MQFLGSSSKKVAWFLGILGFFGAPRKRHKNILIMDIDVLFFCETQAVDGFINPRAILS